MTAGFELEIAGDAVLFPIAIAGGFGPFGSTRLGRKFRRMSRPPAGLSFSECPLGSLGDSPSPGFVLAVTGAHAAYMQSLEYASKGQWQRPNHRS